MRALRARLGRLETALGLAGPCRRCRGFGGAVSMTLSYSDEPLPEVAPCPECGTPAREDMKRIVLCVHEPTTEEQRAMLRLTTDAALR